MQKILKTVLLLCFLMTGAAVFASRTAIIVPAEHSVSVDNNGSARDIYQKNCARCHGEDGKGDTKLGMLLDSPNLTDSGIQNLSRKRISNSISNGKGGMPAFKKKINSKEIASLVNYVRSLK